MTERRRTRRREALVIEMDPPRSKRLKRQEIMKIKTQPVPIVVLTRLPDSVVRAQRPPAPEQDCSEVESLGGSEMWKPGSGSSDSDFCPEKLEPKLTKCRKLSKRNAKTKAASPPSNTNDHNNDAAESSVDKTATTATSPSTTNSNNNDTAESSVAKTTKTTAATKEAASPPSTTNSNNNQTAENSPIVISAVFSHASKEITTVGPKSPAVEFKLDMVVLARRRPLMWNRGKIIAIVEKEGGRLKYKISFEGSGKSLVSAHHLAFCSTAKVDDLYVGARVVVESQDDKSQFLPAILAELPSRKNHSRFLVFLDDHTPLYVSLQLIHLICKPLENALDDIPEGPHKTFLRQYLKSWPYPHLTQYKVGQRVNTELEGQMRKCEITAVDSSLIQVVFQESQQKEWIYRGSIRLEHMAKFLALKVKQENQDN